jgi:hypothetical protein
MNVKQLFVYRSLYFNKMEVFFCEIHVCVHMWENKGRKNVCNIGLFLVQLSVNILTPAQ